MEAHHKYIDVMHVVKGEERFYYKPFASLSHITMPYNAGKECARHRSLNMPEEHDTGLMRLLSHVSFAQQDFKFFD